MLRFVFHCTAVIGEKNFAYTQVDEYDILAHFLFTILDPALLVLLVSILLAESKSAPINQKLPLEDKWSGVFTVTAATWREYSTLFSAPLYGKATRGYQESLFQMQR